MSDHGNALRARIADIIGAYEARTLTLVDALDEIELTVVQTAHPSTLTGLVTRVGGDPEMPTWPTVEIQVDVDVARQLGRHLFERVSLVTTSERELADEAARRG